MSNENTPPAFPTPGKIELRDVPGQGGTKYEHKIPSKDGMTLRDYFAGQVAAGDASVDDGWGVAPKASQLLQRAKIYYAIADAMIEARKLSPEEIAAALKPE